MPQTLLEEKIFKTKPLKIIESGNQNYLLLNVPGDGNCLITSTFLGYFGNFHYDYSIFVSEVEKMFPELPQAMGSYNDLYDVFSNLEEQSNQEKLNPWLLLFREKIANYIANNKDKKYDVESRLPFQEEIIDQLNSQKEKLTKEFKITTSEIEKFKKQIEEIQRTQHLPSEIGIVTEQIKLLESQLNLVVEQITEMNNISDPVNFYLHKLKQDKIWCGSIEISALADLTNCDIKVNIPNGSFQGNYVYKSLEKNDQKPDIVLQFVNNNHYNCYVTNFIQEDRVNKLVQLANKLENLTCEFQDHQIDDKLYEVTKLEYENEREILLEKISQDDEEYALWLQDMYDSGIEEADACFQ